MNWTRTLLVSAAACAALTGLARYSRAQLTQGLQGLQSQQGQQGQRPSLAGSVTPLYALQPESRGVRLELSAVSWGLSGPAFLVEVHGVDPGASRYLDLSGVTGTVTVNGHTAPFLPLAPSVAHPHGGLRAIVPPQWTSWFQAPGQGQDFAFELRRAGESEPTLAGSARNVRS
jgi:hypothetical protein